jgi:hypothetical protein
VTTTVLAGLIWAAPQPAGAQWPERIALTAGLLALAVLGVYGMRRSWRRRTTEQADLLPLPVAPAEPGTPLAASAPGLYVGTTAAGDWQARVVAGGLSHRSRGTLTPYPEFLAVDRGHIEPLTIPREAVRDVRTDRAHAGKVLGPGGLLVVTWEHRGRLLDSGFAADDRGQQDDCLTALRAWVPAHTTGNGGPSPGPLL